MGNVNIALLKNKKPLRELAPCVGWEKKTSMLDILKWRLFVFSCLKVNEIAEEWTRFHVIFYKTCLKIKHETNRSSERKSCSLFELSGRV